MFLASLFRRLCAVAALVLIASLAAQPAGAATWTWNPVTNTWDTTDTNWFGGTGATIWDGTYGPSNIAYFNSATAAPTVSGTVYANGLTFDQAATVSGGTINLSGTTPTITANADAAISSVLDGTNGLIKSGTGTLTLTVANTYSGGTTISDGTLQIGNGTVNGTIGSGTYSIANSAKLYLNYATAAAPTWANIIGGGTLELNSAQAVNGSAHWGAVALPSGFTGTLQLDKGVIVGKPSDLGGAANVVLKDGTQFFLHDGTAGSTTYTYTQNFTIAGMGWGESGQNYGVLRVAGMNAVVSGNITLAGDAGLYTQAYGTASLTASGVIGGTGNLTINDFRNSVTFSGNSSNTYTGTTIVNAGALGLNKAAGLIAIPGNIQMNNNTYLTLYNSGQIASTAQMAIAATTNNWARFALNGNDVTLTGITDAGGAVIQNSQINQSAPRSANLILNLSTTDNNISGYLRDYDNSNSNNAKLGLIVNGTGKLTLSGTNISYTGGTTVNGGTLVLTGGNFNGGLLHGTATVNNGGTLQLNSNGTTNNTDIINVNGGGNLRVVTCTIQDAAPLVGTINLSSANGSAATVTTTDGSRIRFAQGANGLLTSTGATANTFAARIQLTKTDAGRTFTVTADSGNTLNITGGLFDYSGAAGTPVVFNGAGTVVLQGGLVDYSGATTVSAGTVKMLDLDDFWTSGVSVASGAVLEFATASSDFNTQSAARTFSGAGTIRKTGSFLWRTLTGAQTFAMDSGALFDVQAGTIRLEYGGNHNWTSNKADLNIAGGAIFDLWDGNTNVRFDALSGAGTVKGPTHNASAILTVGVDGGSADFSGVIQNGNHAANLVKEGSGIQTLSGTNTYTGSTTVSGGTLKIDGSGVLGGGNYPGTITNNAALVFNTSTNQTLGGAISGSGSLTQSGSSVLKLSGDNSGLSGPTAVTAGTLELAAAGTLSASDITVGASGTFQVDAAGKTLKSLSVGGGTTLALPAATGQTTTVTNALTFSAPDITVKPLFVTVPTASDSFDLLTTGSTIVSSGTITPDLTAYAPTRVAGTVTVSDNKLVWTSTSGPASLTWTNATADNKWNLNSSANFDGTVDHMFQTFDSVAFGDATSGTVALEGNLQAGIVTVNTATTYTFGGSGAITGPASLVKQGAGTLVLTGANSYSGGTSVNEGTVQIGDGSTTSGTIGSGAYSIASGVKLYLNYLTANGANLGNVTGAGTIELNSAGSGTAAGNWDNGVLSSGFTGTLQVDKGRFFAPSAGVAFGGATNVVIQNGAQFGDWVGGTFSQNFTLAGYGWGEGNYNVSIRGGNTQLNGNVTLAGDTALGGVQINGTLYGAGHALAVGDSGSRDLTLNSETATSLGNISLNWGTLTIGSSGNVTCGVIGGPGGGGRAGLNVAAGGTLTATGFYTAYNVSQFQINGTASLGDVTFSVAAEPTMTGSGTLNVTSLTIRNNTHLTDSMVGGTMNVGAGGIIYGSVNGGYNSFAVGATTIGATAAWNSTMPMSLTDATTGATFDTTGGNITLNGALGGAGALKKAGSGVLTFSGANNYAGGTTVNNGTLRFGANNTLPSGGAVAINNGATLDLATYSTSTQPVGTVTLVDGSITGTLPATLAASGFDVRKGTIGVILGGVGAGLVKTTGDTVTLSAPNAYDGLTDVQAGTLALDAQEAIPGALQVSGGATVAAGANSTHLGTVTLVDGSITGTGTFYGTGYDVRKGQISVNLADKTPGNSLTKTTADTVTLSGANTYTGTTTISAGTLLVNGSLGAGGDTISVTTNGTLGGTGTINRYVEAAGGTMAPGSSGIGKLTLGGGLNLETDGVFQWELGTLTDDTTGVRGTDFDAADVTGGYLVMGGTSALTLDFNQLGEGNGPGETTPVSFWNSAHSWKLLDVTGSSGNDGNLPFDSITGGGVYTLGQFTTTVQSGNVMLNYVPNTLPFSGSAMWIGTTGANWNLAANWQDTLTGNETVHEVPGINGNNQTAQLPTIGEGGNTMAITLADAQPNLAALKFSGTTAYTINGATGTGKIVMDNGSGNAAIQVEDIAAQVIDVPVTLASDTDVTTTADSALTVSGKIDGAGILTKTGDGTLTLSNSANDYAGTTVTGGTLVIGSAGALPAGKSLSIGSGGTLILGGGLAMGTSAQSAEPVPEPGTLALLAIAALAGAMIWRRKRD